MAKLKFTPNPTFKLAVNVPVPGEEQPGELIMTIRHVTPQALAEITKESTDKINAANEADDEAGAVLAMAECIKALAVGWEWEHEFNDTNIIGAMCNYPRFYDSLLRQVSEELWAVRAKR